MGRGRKEHARTVQERQVRPRPVPARAVEDLRSGDPQFITLWPTHQPVALNWARVLRGGWLASRVRGGITDGVQRTSDHLGGCLHHDPARRDLISQEVEERCELGWTDRVGTAISPGALVTDLVEHELDPIGRLCGVVLRVRDVQLERGELRGLLGVRWRTGRVWVDRRDGLAERPGLRDPGDAPAALVPAVPNDGLARAIEGSEGVRERFGTNP
jgi:hypothetical protein